MNVPATINKVLQVVEYGYLPEPMLPANSSPSGLPYTHFPTKPVQNVAVCRVGTTGGYTAAFCTQYWEQVPVMDALPFFQSGPLTLDEAKLIPQKLFGLDVTAWRKLEEITATGSYERRLARPNSLEALAWLQSPELAFRTFGGNGIRKGYAGKRAVSYVQRLYQHGAKQVTAIEIQTSQSEAVRQMSVARGMPETDIIEATDELIVELPEDLQARAALIRQWITTFGRKTWDVPADAGQPYLLFRWS